MGSVSNGFDGDLPSWQDIRGPVPWPTLVLGNGFSVNIWESFKYDSLYEEARKAGLIGLEDTALFDHLGATNFEAVLRSVNESIRVGEALGLDRSEEHARYQSIQGALADAVHRVHVPPGYVPHETLEIIKSNIVDCKHVFTTSYDLLLYWAMGCDDDFSDFLDFFWAGNHGDAFDESTHTFGDDDTRTRMYFLHGALHIAVMGDDTTCKRRAGHSRLLDTFSSPYRGDQASRPLVVSESHATSKERVIAGNQYLSYCWQQLARCDSPTVVLGHALNDQDQHLIDALNAADRPVAIGIHPKTTPRDNKSEKHRISAALADIRSPVFFDSTTHPLASKRLQVSSNPFLRGIMRNVRR